MTFSIFFYRPKLFKVIFSSNVVMLRQLNIIYHTIYTQRKENFNSNEKIKPPRTNHHCSSIINKEAAVKMLKHLKEDLEENEMLIEIDPGTGIFTKLLLSSINNKILLFKASDSLQKELQTQFETKCKNIVFSPLNIHDAQKYFHRSQHEVNYPDYSNFLQTLHQNSSESQMLKIIGAISSNNLLYIVMINFAHQNMFYGSLNTSLLLYVSDEIYSSITKSSKILRNWRLGIFANLCFDITNLGNVPEACFHTKLCSKFRHSMKNNNNFHLLKFTPRKFIGNFDTIKVDTKDLAPFFFFVNYFIRVSTKTPIIAALEIFIPSIGKEMIKNGFKVYDSSYYLTNDEWVKAFKIFSSHPNYSNNAFIKVMTDDFRTFGYYYNDYDEEYIL